MMAVYYRYRSGVETFSVPVPAPAIAVADLKRLITGTSRHGHVRTRGGGPRECVALSDARTGEEYADDDAMVPRGSTVVVRRVVGGPPAETITVVARSPPPPKGKAAQDDDASADDSARKPISSVPDDEEDRAISAVIDAARMAWDDHRRPSQGCYGRRAAAQDRRPPPAGYVCHRCRVPGHFIQHCPTNGDPRFDFGSRARTSTTDLPGRAPAAASASTIADDGVPPELHCKMCKKVTTDAVVTRRCCFDSCCDACIRGHVVARSKCVCGARASADDLIPNQTLRVTIANTLATRAPAAAVSGVSANQKSSSAGSNEEATSRSPAASRSSQGSHSQPVTELPCSERSDGSASSTSKNAATRAIVREPRTKQTRAESAQTMEPRAGYPKQFGYGGGPLFRPACYDPFFFGGMPWPHPQDPYMYSYGVPYGGGYPMVSAPPTTAYHDGAGHGRKRTMGRDDGRFEEPGFKKRCGSRSPGGV